MHARLVLADAGERAAERRMDDAPRDAPAEEQDDKRIAIGGLAEEIEVEEAEDRRPSMPCSPSAPPVIERRLVGRFLQHLRDDQRQHQKRQALACAARSRPTTRPTSPAPNAATTRAADRLAPAMRRQEAGDIGAGAEERGMAQA